MNDVIILELLYNKVKVLELVTFELASVDDKI